MSRQLIVQSTSYNPATIALLVQAFDQAWASIAARYHGAFTIEAKRELLACSILDLASVGERNVDVLARGAVLTIDHAENPTPLKAKCSRVASE